MFGRFVAISALVGALVLMVPANTALAEGPTGTTVAECDCGGALPPDAVTTSDRVLPWDPAPFENADGFLNFLLGLGY